MSHQHHRGGKHRRRFLATLGAATAALATGVGKLMVPEAQAQASAIESQLVSMQEWKVSLMDSDELNSFYQAAISSADVATLVDLAPRPIVPLYKVESFGTTMESADWRFKTLLIPFAFSDADEQAVAYVLQGTVTCLIEGESYGVEGVLNSIAFASGTVYAARNGNIRPDPNAAAYLAALFGRDDVEKQVGGGHVRPRPLPPEPCYRNCNLECSTRCNAAKGFLGAGGALAVGCAWTWWTGAGLVLCGASAVGSTAGAAWAYGCNRCRRNCAQHNRRCYERGIPIPSGPVHWWGVVT